MRYLMGISLCFIDLDYFGVFIISQQCSHAVESKHEAKQLLQYYLFIHLPDRQRTTFPIQGCLLALLSGGWQVWVFQSEEPRGQRDSASKSLSQQKEEVGERRDVDKWWVTTEAGSSLKDPGRGEKQPCIQQLITFNVTFLWQAFILMDGKIFEKTEYAVKGCLIFPPRWPSCWWVSVTWRKSQKLQLWAGKRKQRPEGLGVWLGWGLRCCFVYLGQFWALEWLLDMGNSSVYRNIPRNGMLKPKSHPFFFGSLILRHLPIPEETSVIPGSLCILLKQSKHWRSQGSCSLAMYQVRIVYWGYPANNSNSE